MWVPRVVSVVGMVDKPDNAMGMVASVIPAANMVKNEVDIVRCATGSAVWVLILRVLPFYDMGHGFRLTCVSQPA
jgi:hypothetical protein